MQQQKASLKLLFTPVRVFDCRKKLVALGTNSADVYLNSSNIHVSSLMLHPQCMRSSF